MLKTLLSTLLLFGLVAACSPSADTAAPEEHVVVLKDGKVVAADAVNSPKEFMVCKQLIGKAVDPALLADPDTELKVLLA